MPADGTHNFAMNSGYGQDQSQGLWGNTNRNQEDATYHGSESDSGNTESGSGNGSEEKGNQILNENLPPTNHQPFNPMADMQNLHSLINDSAVNILPQFKIAALLLAQSIAQQSGSANPSTINQSVASKEPSEHGGSSQVNHSQCDPMALGGIDNLDLFTS